MATESQWGQEFQAVILAGGRGNRLYPLTEDKPKALLPLVNRPMLYYQLAMLEDSGAFHNVLVVTTKELAAPINKYLAEEYSGGMSIECVPIENNTGTVDCLRAVKDKLHADFLVISSDLVTDVPLYQMADVHRINRAAVTVLLKEQPEPKEGEEKKKKSKTEDATFVGLDAKQNRLLYIAAAADNDGSISMRKSLFQKFPNVTLHQGMMDAHFYFFAHWTLEILEQKQHFQSIKFELLPYLVRKQYVSKPDTLPTAVTDPPLALALGMVSTKARLHAEKPSVHCCCYIQRADAGFCGRANTIATYLSLNEELARGAVPRFAATKAEYEEGQKKDRSFGMESARGNFVEVGNKSTIKKSTVGHKCKIGAHVKLQNCVIMDNVTIEDKVQLTSTVVGSGATIQQGCDLKNCQVGAGHVVEAGTQSKNEALLAESDDED